MVSIYGMAVKVIINLSRETHSYFIDSGNRKRFLSFIVYRKVKSAVTSFYFVDIYIYKCFLVIIIYCTIAVYKMDIY